MALQIGYQLSSEEHRPADLVRYARMAEDHGFDYATISDHFHPWIDAQGQSPFVWSVIGAVAQATRNLPLGTWVTCPTTRIHPAIIAHASATVAAMMPVRTSTSTSLVTPGRRPRSGRPGWRRPSR